jgi:hypothetical protein
VTSAAGLPFDLVQDAAFAVGHGIGHGNGMRCEVMHQAQIKRQLLGAQALEQREHEAPMRGADEVVGVFDAAGDALQLGERAEVEPVQE